MNIKKLALVWLVFALSGFYINCEGGTKTKEVLVQEEVPGEDTNGNYDDGFKDGQQAGLDEDTGKPVVYSSGNKNYLMPGTYKASLFCADDIECKSITYKIGSNAATTVEDKTVEFDITVDNTTPVVDVTFSAKDSAGKASTSGTLQYAYWPEGCPTNQGPYRFGLDCYHSGLKIKYVYEAVSQFGTVYWTMYLEPTQLRVTSGTLVDVSLQSICSSYNSTFQTCTGTNQMLQDNPNDEAFNGLDTTYSPLTSNTMSLVDNGDKFQGPIWTGYELDTTDLRLYDVVIEELN